MSTTESIIITTEIEKSYKDMTEQLISAYRENKGGVTIVRPTYSRQMLLSACERSSVNMRCIITKANTTAGMGYTFEDEENAKNSGVLNFIANLKDRNGDPQPFAKLLSDYMVDYGMFGDSYLEITRAGKRPINLLLFSAKNAYLNMDKTAIIQIILYGENNNKIVVFRPYGEYQTGGKIENDVLSLSRQTAFDDVYGVPVWIPALSAIEENYKISQMNLEVMSNIVNPSFASVLTGRIPDQEVKAYQESIRQIKARKGSAYVVHFSDPEAKATTTNFGANAVDGNYINQRSKNELEIMSLHGITPELYGTMQTGGISSGEKATGALKIFLQTTIRPEQEMLSKKIDSFFIKEFPGYKGGFKLNEIDLTDSLEDEQINQLRANIQQTYLNMGSLTLLNEYRKDVGLVELTDVEFKQMQSAAVPSFGI